MGEAVRVEASAVTLSVSAKLSRVGVKPTYSPLPLRSNITHSVTLR